MVRNAENTDLSGSHPARIPTRLVTSKKAESLQHHDVDMESLRATPELYKKNVDLLRSYPNMLERVAGKSHAMVEREALRHIQDNLLDLHDRVPEHIRQRSKLWYDGARNITDQWSKEFNVPDYAVAGALAALSPQKDWYQNVSLARRVLQHMRGNGENFYKGMPFSDDMMKTFLSRESLNKPAYQNLINSVRGKTLHDLDRMSGTPEEAAARKALWIRMHDETYGDSTHELITPEGGTGDLVKTDKGVPAKVAWGSLTEIAKAIRSIEATDPRELSQLMGERHKVRNFYNNILDPRSNRGDVTIDTHAVAAGLMRPLSGNSLEVIHNFGNYPGKDLPTAGGSALTGVQGLYPLYAQAYRDAARERGILPREMQSITWEAVRGLFPDTFKTKANAKKVDDIWQRYRKGKLSQAEAREMIHGIAGGIRHPTWFSGDDGQAQNPSNQGQLPQLGLPGSAPGAALGGGGSGIAGTVPQEVVARASGGRAGDAEQDKKLVAKAIHTHDRQMHGGKLTDLRELQKARGGSVNHSPTEAQKAAGNYAKKHITFQGIPIAIENALGSTRSGRDHNGKAWSCKLPADYGYIKRSMGADGDQVDAYVGPDVRSNLVVVVDQHDPHQRGRFDEHKCLLGFKSEREALDCYRKGFSDGSGDRRIGAVKSMSVDAFKQWLKRGKTTKPAARQDIVAQALKLVNRQADVRT